MTRFTRAHGSKSSNERLPEEATSWQVMRKQLLEAQQQQTSHQQQEGTGNVFKEDVEEVEKQEWAVFDTKPRKKKAKTRKGKTFVEAEKDVDDEQSVLGVGGGESNHYRKKRIKDNQEVYNSLIVKQKKMKKRKAHTGEFFTPTQENIQMKLKREKSEQSHSMIDMENNSERENKKYGKSEAIRESRCNKRDLERQVNRSSQARICKKNGKIHKRRKPDEGSTSWFINGQKVEIIKFDGFPVKKDDAERLKQLRQKLISKGIPSDEINRTLKLERRKAEKALAREKKKVCFHCRKPGHNLSECPELDDGKNQDVQGTGICFKCGSTEHTYYECRVNRSEGFQFAKCFVCNEQGHIARQCPDNPRGLYPKGGACRICGDVTHLKKDCPDLVQEKKEQTITLETLKGGAVEALNEDLTQHPQKKVNRKQKHIQF